MITAILDAIPPEGATHEQIAILSGYNPETVWSVLCELQTAGMVFSLAPYWHRTNLPGGSNHA